MDLRRRPETECGNFAGGNLAAGPGESALVEDFSVEFFFPVRVLPLLVVRFDDSFGSFSRKLFGTLREVADAFSISSGVP